LRIGGQLVLTRGITVYKKMKRSQPAIVVATRPGYRIQR
jgi:hypothetical protein